MQGLSGREAGIGAGEIADGRGHLLRRAATPDQRARRLVVGRFGACRRMLAVGVDHPRGDEVDGHAARAELMGQRLGQPVEPGLCRDDMGAMQCARVGGEAADIDDRPLARLSADAGWPHGS